VLLLTVGPPLPKYVYLYVYADAHIHIHMRAKNLVCMSTYCMPVCVCIHIHTHAYACARVHTSTHTHIHTHTCRHAAGSLVPTYLDNEGLVEAHKLGRGQLFVAVCVKLFERILVTHSQKSEPKGQYIYDRNVTIKSAFENVLP
jgi:hypothetical protein